VRALRSANLREKLSAVIVVAPIGVARQLDANARGAVSKSSRSR
jgi:hypothetical protein